MLLLGSVLVAFSQVADRDRSKYAVNNFAEDDKYTMLQPYETVCVKEPKVKRVKNIIFMIGDGMGLEQISAAWVCNGGKLNLDNFTKVGIQRTYSANRLVTDSAAAGTALATGHKTNNGMVSMTPDTVIVKSLAEEAMEKGKKIIDITCQVNSNIVTTHIGVIPEDTLEPVFQNMVHSIGACAEYAAQCGANFAIETGPERSTVLQRLLKDVNSPALGINLDPANLAMVVRDDAEQAAEVLGPWIVHTHAKDGKNFRPCNPANEYGTLELSDLTPGYDKAALGRAYLEVPLGQGDVNWDGYFRTLNKIGYNGFLTIEREVGDTPKADIQLAVDFLKARMG